MKDRQPTTSYPQKVIGRISWAYYDQSPVDEARIERSFIRSSTELYLECWWDGWLYPIQIRSQDGFSFAGTFNATFGSESSRVTVTARLYSSRSRYCVIGEWTEAGEDFLWWAEIEEVDAFLDQQQPA